MDGLGEPKLIGRDKELQKLDHYLKLAVEGKGNTVFVSGEAGSGKTRLASEFLIYAATKNVTTLSGWCLSNATVPYFPFLEAFDCYLSGNEGRTANSQQALKTWLVGSSELNKIGSMTPQAWKDQAFAAVLKQLLLISTHCPTVLFVDDLHWADSASLALLHYIARSIVSERILVIATFRSEEVRMGGSYNQLNETLRLMGREGLFEEMKLPSLSQADVGEIIESMLGGKANPRFVQKLAAESQGLPLFVVESLRMLHEQKELTKEHEEWRLTVENFDTPAKVKDVILRRIEALNPKRKRILEVASALGEKFDPKLIGAVVSQDSFAVLDSLNEMSRTLLIYCEGDYYCFSHAKIRELLYDQIPNLLKKEYHLRIAQKLEASTKNSKEITVGDLAYHYAQAGNKAKSIHFSIAAGNFALARFSNKEALKHFTYALKIISEDSEHLSKKKAALEGLGEAFFANSMFKEAIATFEQLSGVTTGAVRLRALRRAMDATFFQGDFAHLLELTNKAGEFAEVDRLEYARVLMNRGRAVVFLGNYLAGREDFEKALQIFEEECSLPDMALVLCGLGGNRTEKGLARALHAVALYNELGDDRGLMGACFRAGQSYGYRMLTKEALEMYARAVSIGKKIGNFNKMAEAIASSSWSFEAIGDWTEALSRSLEALEYCKKTNSDWVRGITYSNLIRQYSVLGDMENAAEFFEKIQKLPLEVVSDFVFVRFGLSKAVFLAAKGHWTEAIAYFDGFRKAMARLGSEINPSDVIMHQLYYEWVLLRQNKIEEAKQQIRETDEMSQKVREYFENTIVQPILLVPRKIEIDEQFTLRIHIINVSKKPVELFSIEALNFAGLNIESMPDYCSLQGSNINMNGKKLDAFQVILINFNLRATKEGDFHFNPKLIYTDNLQKNITCELKPATIVIKSRDFKTAAEKSTSQISSESSNSVGTQSKTANETQIIFEFKTEAAKRTFDFLIYAFIQDYMHRKFSLEKSGWRTLTDIIKNGSISKFSAYGDKHKKGQVMPQLEKRGLIEIRVFPGERGRGGKILKVRVCYEKEPIKHLIEQRIMKNH